MIIFPIPGTGSSGHIAGGLLLAVLLGPYAAFIAIASVITVQCLLFADGGLLALGCNILNMGFWPCFVGLPFYRRISGASPSPRRSAVAAVVASVASLQLGALCVVIETVLSGRSELPFTQFGAVMLGIHLPIGFVEGLITAGVLRVLYRTRDGAASQPAATAPVLVGSAFAALIVSGVMAWYASQKPDGLEWSVARITGATELSAPGSGVHSVVAALQRKTAVMPDYQLPVSMPRLGHSLAGVSGAVVVGIVVCALGIGAAGARRVKSRAEVS